MDKLIQYSTKASRYDGEFGGDAGWPAAGMGYVFVTEENRLIVVDGGHGEDAEALLHLLRELKGEETPTVDLWIVTPPTSTTTASCGRSPRRRICGGR